MVNLGCKFGHTDATLYIVDMNVCTLHACAMLASHTLSTSFTKEDISEGTMLPSLLHPQFEHVHDMNSTTRTRSFWKKILSFWEAHASTVSAVYLELCCFESRQRCACHCMNVYIHPKLAPRYGQTHFIPVQHQSQAESAPDTKTSRSLHSPVQGLAICVNI